MATSEQIMARCIERLAEKVETMSAGDLIRLYSTMTGLGYGDSAVEVGSVEEQLKMAKDAVVILEKMVAEDAALFEEAGREYDGEALDLEETC
jgi:hypothetical protein